MMTVGCHHLSAREFQDRLAAAKPAETFVYAIGFLVVDIHAAFLNKAPTVGGLAQVARLALAASSGGDAFLTQRRVGSGCFEYRATKANGASR